MAYTSPEFIKEVPGLFVPFRKLRQQALIVLPGKIIGDKGKKQRHTEQYQKAAKYDFVLF